MSEKKLQETVLEEEDDSSGLVEEETPKNYNIHFVTKFFTGTGRPIEEGVKDILFRFINASVRKIFNEEPKYSITSNNRNEVIFIATIFSLRTTAIKIGKKVVDSVNVVSHSEITTV